MKKLKLTTAISDKIIEELQIGKPLTKICSMDGMPSLTTVYRWMREDEDFTNQIEMGRRCSAQTWLDKAQEILDREDIPPQSMQIVREKLHHIRFLASKLISLYGDKTTVTNKGDSSLTIKWEVPSLPLSVHTDAALRTHDGDQKDNAATLEDKQP